MEITDLKQMTKEEVFNFIRQRLSFSKELQEQFRHVNKDDLAKEHRRFEMSGNESKTGQCTIFNTAILNAMTRMMKEKRSIMFFWLGIMGLVFLY